MKAFKAGGPDQDVSNIYLCPFCKGSGTLNCFTCRGAAKNWPAQINVEARASVRKGLSHVLTPLLSLCSGCSSGGTSTRARTSGIGGRS